MKLKMVGLGKMGLNLALNMKEHGVDVEGFDVNEEARKKAESENIKTYASLEDVASKDEKNVIWVMLPAGKITNSVLLQLVELCKANDIVIDGGNSDHRDSLKTARLMEEKGIYFFDIGTSGGVYGARHGASFMCGGDPDVFKNELQEMLESIATTNGCLYTGKTGSGHYLKMIHNAMLSHPRAVTEHRPAVCRNRREPCRSPARTVLAPSLHPHRPGEPRRTGRVLQGRGCVVHGEQQYHSRRPYGLSPAVRWCRP